MRTLSLGTRYTYVSVLLLPSIKELTFLTEVFMKNDSLVMSTVHSSRTTPSALMMCFRVAKFSEMIHLLVFISWTNQFGGNLS